MANKKLNRDVGEDDFSDLLELSKSAMKKLWDNKEDEVWERGV